MLRRAPIAPNPRLRPLLAPGFTPTSLLGIPIRGSACVGLVLSGGNVDPDLFARVLRGEI